MRIGAWFALEEGTTMAVDFRIVPSRGMVVVTYSGMAGVDETRRAFEAYVRHPEFRPGQRHLFDVRAVTEVDKDFAAFFALQAKLVEVYGQASADQLAVFLIGSPAGQEMAMMAAKTWDMDGSIVIRILETEAQALEVLGQPERSLADLLRAAGAELRD